MITFVDYILTSNPSVTNTVPQIQVDSTVYFYAGTKTIHTSYGASGMQKYEFMSGQVEVVYPDTQERHVTFSDGTKKIVRSNGEVRGCSLM